MRWFSALFTFLRLASQPAFARAFKNRLRLMRQLGHSDGGLYPCGSQVFFMLVGLPVDVDGCYIETDAYNAASQEQKGKKDDAHAASSCCFR